MSGFQNLTPAQQQVAYQKAAEQIRAIKEAVPEIGVKQDRHSLSHHNANPKLMQDLQDSDAFITKEIAQSSALRCKRGRLTRQREEVTSRCQLLTQLLGGTGDDRPIVEGVLTKDPNDRRLPRGRVLA
jgi:hypothetical protein